MATNLSSSNLQAVEHDRESGVLTVAFRGGRVYQYDNVPREVFVELLRAPSKGKFLHSRIKGVYGYRRVK